MKSLKLIVFISVCSTIMADIDPEMPIENNEASVDANARAVNPRPTIAPHIKVNRKANATDKPIVKCFNCPQTSNANTKQRRLASLGAVIEEVNQERGKTISSADILIPDDLPTDLKQALQKEKLKLVSKQYIDPAKDEFAQFLRSHGTEEKSYREIITNEPILHSNFRVANGADVVSLSKNFHYQINSTPLANSDIKINILNRLPQERSIALHIKDSFESQFYRFTHNYIKIVVLSGRLTLTLMGQNMDVKLLSVIWIRPGMQFKLAVREGGASLMMDFKATGASFVRESLTPLCDKYYYIPHNPQQ